MSAGNPDGPVVVCFAVEDEARPFRQWASGKPGVLVLVTGMGSENAKRSVTALLSRCRPSVILSCGFAGGLTQELNFGDLVFDCSGWPHLTDCLEGTGARAARFHCAPVIAVTRKQKHELRQKQGMDAVEMESGIICGMARQAGVRHGILRVILDEVDEDLPLDFNRLVNANFELAMGRLLLALARSPGKIPVLIRFGARSRQAANRLCAALIHTLNRLCSEPGPAEAA